MSNFKVEVVKLTKFERHKNADTLCIANIFDYPVIFKDNWAKIDDLVAYIPVDAVVPIDRSEFSFLANAEKPDRKTERVRAKKLRGVFSMGFLIPAPEGSKEGDDVKDILGIKKYEEPDTPAIIGGEEEKDPGFMPCYTSIENVRRYGYILNDGEEVVCTEKRHGCVTFDTKISISDGSRKRISEIKVGDEILGAESDGRVVPTKVVNTFDNGKAEEWLKIKGDRTGAGRGSSFFTLTCTPKHQIWSETSSAYVEAQNLKIGDNLALLRSELGLTPIQEQVLLGKMLGDGYLHDTKWSAAVTWAHSGKDKEYVEWTANALGDIAHPSRSHQVSGYGSNMIRAHTVFNAHIKKKFSDFYSDDGTKRIPEWVSESLSPITLAFWYMDDGSLSHHADQEDRAAFAVCAFTEDDCKILQKGFKSLV